jgi:hypothetical protein
LGIGDWAQSPIPNPQSPIPNPQSPLLPLKKYEILFLFLLDINVYLVIKIKKNWNK